MFQVSLVGADAVWIDGGKGQSSVVGGPAQTTTQSPAMCRSPQRPHLGLGLGCTMRTTKIEVLLNAGGSGSWKEDNGSDNHNDEEDIGRDNDGGTKWLGIGEGLGVVVMSFAVVRYPK